MGERVRVRGNKIISLFYAEALLLSSKVLRLGVPIPLVLHLYEGFS
jgi:hypothetical protein